MPNPPHIVPARVAATRPFPPVEGTLDRALALVEYLREHCPWDRKQTARSLVPHLLEETAETVDAIHAGDGEALCDELGDLLLNLAFQVVVAEQEHRFDRTEVVEALERKMIGRHPHLFGLGDEEPWEVLKARERRSSGEDVEPTGVLQDLAGGLDPLSRAHRMQERVAGVGFDWNDASGALAKVREELGEVEEALAEGSRPRVEEEMGDLLFSVVNLARLADTHAVPALAAANGKFRSRFEALESLARERDVPIPGASLEELDRLWDEIKEKEADKG